MTEPSVPIARQLTVAVVVGVAAALGLLVFEGTVHVAERLLWEALPERIGIESARWWALPVLTAAGLAVGLILHLAPGHGGHDPATEGLAGPPMALSAVPGLLAAAVVTLAGGVSMGPEAPLLGTFGAILAWVAARRGMAPEGLVAVGMAGVLGAMFGAPVGAAFAFAELIPAAGKDLYDRLLPLFAAATAGALTVTLVATRPQFQAPFPAPRAFIVVDLFSAAAIGALGAAVGLAMGVLLRVLHPLAHRLPVVLRVTAGGLALGLVAVAVGERVLFSGQRELPSLLLDPPASGRTALLIAGKLLAVTVALAVGFRGGKIFPAVFAGVALGVLIHDLIPGVPLVLAAGAATVGIVLALIRVWMLTLLLVAMIVGVTALPLLGVALIAAHLVVTGRPEVVARATTAAGHGHGQGR